MIDTIKLTLEQGSFIILEPEKFHPKADIVMSNTKFPIAKAIQNQTKQDKQDKVYKPKLTLNKSYGDITLSMEFSIPKILFGNNFEEVGGKDFDFVIRKLYDILLTMGVKVMHESYLEEAKVKVVHYGKNFILTDAPMNPVTMINLIAKADTTYRTDITEKRYRNGGQLVSFYTGVQDIVFYDKMKDLQKSLNISKARSEEVDSELQRQFLSEYGRHEVLRMEVRLTDVPKIQRVIFKTTNEELDIVRFKHVFNEDLAKKVLRTYLLNIKSMLHDVIASHKDSNDLLRYLLSEGIKPKQAFVHIKAMELINEYGSRNFRMMFSDIYRGYKKLMASTAGRGLKEETAEELFFIKAFQYLENILYHFRPIRLENGKDIYGNATITDINSSSNPNTNDGDFEYLPSKKNPKYKDTEPDNINYSPEQEREKVVSDFFDDEDYEVTKI